MYVQNFIWNVNSLKSSRSIEDPNQGLFNYLIRLLNLNMIINSLEFRYNYFQLVFV